MVNGIREGVESATPVMSVSRASADIIIIQTEHAGIALDSISSDVYTISSLTLKLPARLSSNQWFLMS